jgi:SPFH domain / Band 7 family
MLFGAYPGADGPSLSLLISGEGTVTMDFSLQYTLNNNTLVTLYQSFGTAYKGRFAQAVTSSLQAALLQPSNNITVRNFYDSRQRVASVAQAAAATALQANGATLIGFQILRVSLPTTVENNIINTLVSSQQQLTAGMIQSQVSINAATSFYVGLIDQAISVYTSNQTALAGEFHIAVSSLCFSLFPFVLIRVPLLALPLQPSSPTLPTRRPRVRP